MGLLDRLLIVRRLIDRLLPRRLIRQRLPRSLRSGLLPRCLLSSRHLNLVFSRNFSF
jgi:hypothetical protein